MIKRGLMPKKNGAAEDIVMTPDELAYDIVKHFSPQIVPGSLLLEPCSGEGAFMRAFHRNGFTNTQELELSRGQDFFKFHGKADWIITNPPWSKCRDFLRHSYEVADNVVVLISMNHVIGQKARWRDMVDFEFGVKEVFMVPEPLDPWPGQGFQLAAHHLQRGWTGPQLYSRLPLAHECRGSIKAKLRG